MELFGIVFNQVIMMCLMMFAGGVCYLKKWIDDDGVKQISNLLLYIVNPLTIITAYQTPFSMEKFNILLKTFIFSMIIFLATLILVYFLFGKWSGVEQFGIAFGNCGFIGIPLVKAILGDEAVFQLSAFLIVTNFFCWTYGIYLMSHDKKYMTLKKAILNPGTIGTFFGLLLFFSPVKLPDMIFEGVRTLGNLNTPLAMIILGAYIIKSDIKTLFASKRLYLLSLLRLVVIPVFCLVLIYFLPIQDYTIAMTIFIACSAPAAVNTMILAIQFGGDGTLGAKFVSLSSILSMMTLPIILSLANLIF